MKPEIKTTLASKEAQLDESQQLRTQSPEGIGQALEIAGSYADEAKKCKAADEALKPETVVDFKKQARVGASAASTWLTSLIRQQQQDASTIPKAPKQLDEAYTEQQDRDRLKKKRR